MTFIPLLLLAAPQQAGVSPEECLALFVHRPGHTELSGRVIARPLADGVEAARALLGEQVLHEFAEVREFVATVPAGNADADYARMLLASGLFEYVTPDWIVYPVGNPNDPFFGNQWHHATMNSAAAWDWITDATPIVAAFTDTGVDLNHPDLAASLVSGFNAVEDLPQSQGGSIQDINGHGTLVAGTIGAIGNNASGLAGVCWQVGLMPCRVSNDPGGGAYLSDLEQAARWAVDNGAKTISASYTGVQNASIDTTGSYVRSQGGIYVYAADNYNQNHGGFDWADVVVSGATDWTDNKAYFSSYGRAVDCAAPGQDIWTTGLGGGYYPVSGTSFSTPMTNGALALMWAANPYLTSWEVEQRLYAGCEDLGAPGEDDVYGHGRIDLERAVIEAVTGSLDLSVNNLMGGLTASLTATGATPGARVWFVYSLSGTAITDVPQIHATIALSAPALLGSAIANGAGVATLQRFVPQSASGLMPTFMAAEDGNGSNFMTLLIL